MHTVLILTVSIGNGHNQAAFNIHQKLHSAGYEVKTIDLLKAENYGFNTFLSKAYQKLIEYKPELFRHLCKMSEIDTFDNVKHMLAKMNQRMIGRLVKEYQPDIIVCTHFSPLAAAAEYKKKYCSSFRLVGIVTDYIVHPIWEVAHVDQYFVAHPSLVKQFKHYTNSLNTIIPSGIPSGSDFTPKIRLTDINKILVMTSGQTVQNLLDMIAVLQTLPHYIEITFVTGKDTERQKQLEQLTKNNTNFRVIGFTNQVATLMKGSDLLITKPGGLTVTEALATATPLLVFSPIPGIEEDNARFLETNHLGYWARNKTQLNELITELLQTPAERMLMSQRMLTLQNSQATNSIVNYLIADLDRKVAL